MDQVLAQNKTFKLTKRSKNGKKWYEINCDAWAVTMSHYLTPGTKNGYAKIEEIRDFFDPTRNKAGQWGTAWKYKNRRDAEQMFLTATLKWAGQ